MTYNVFGGMLNLTQPTNQTLHWILMKERIEVIHATCRKMRCCGEISSR